MHWRAKHAFCMCTTQAASRYYCLPDICDFQFQTKYSGVMQFCRTRVICPRFKDQGGFGRLIAEIKRPCPNTDDAWGKVKLEP